MIVLTCLVLWAGAGCAPKERAAEPFAPLPDGMKAQKKNSEGGMDQKMLTFTFSEYTHDGKKKLEIEGESADIFASSINLSNIIATLHNTREAITITSDSGVFDRTTTNVQLVHNVIAESEDGSRVTTDSMNYDSESGIGTTDDFTKITRDDMISTGTGAVVYSKERRAQLNSNVRVQFASAGEPLRQPTVITCDGRLQIDYEKRIAIFHENVLVTDERGTVRGDLMEVFLEPEEKEIERIVCTGNVHIRQGPNQTFSDSAVYLAKEGRVILTGSPKLVLYPDELKGTDVFIRNKGTGQDL